MKKISFILVAVLSVLSLRAQEERRHEVSLGVGIFSSTELVDIFGDIIVTGITNGTYGSDDRYSGALSLGYKYRATSWIGLGGTFIYENARANAFIHDVKNGKFRDNYFTLAAEADFIYLRMNRLSLYGLVGAGATLMSQRYIPDTGEESTNNNVFFNFQFTPIGLKYGNRFGGFVEAGFGYKGVLSIGAFARFW